MSSTSRGDRALQRAGDGIDFGESGDELVGFDELEGRDE
jgi:hypothetical protein